VPRSSVDFDVAHGVRLEVVEELGREARSEGETEEPGSVGPIKTFDWTKYNVGIRRVGPYGNATIHVIELEFRGGNATAQCH
jgi:hypothetical protein